MANISPGVYTKIIDLSAYVAAVPGTIAFIAGLTAKGEDNVMKFVGSRGEFIGEFGDPNITDYGKNYGQGPYLAYNYLGESGSLYWMRVLPDDATYANFRIDGTLSDTDSSAGIQITYLSGVNSKAEIKTNLEAPDATTFPLCVFYPIGRGEYYNGISLRLTPHSNPTLNGVYVLDIYEKQSDNQDVIIESFEISFDPNALDLAGDSLWVEYVLQTYSTVLRCEMLKADGNYAPGYDLLVKVYDKDIGTVSVDEVGGSITDNKQNFSDWQTSPETGNATYMVVAKDGRGNSLYGWLGAATGTTFSSVNVFNGRDLDTASRGWVGDLTAFDSGSTITYQIKKANTSISDTFVSSEGAPLKLGSDGSLKNSSGDLDTTVATEILANAYDGTVDDNVLDTELYYFSVVFDAGYPTDVKTQIVNLATTRRDCVAILDNGDNATFNASIDKRVQTHKFNTYYAALYEEFNKVYDIFTGQDVWFSPLYHIAYLLPRNDSVAEVWWAIAGYERGAIQSIKELRFNPKLSQRDQMYLKQLNPVVKFSDGYVVWGNLTTQARATALQDLNIVRLVLYAKKALETFCRYYIFTMNDGLTWSSVQNGVIEFLEDLKSRRGLDSYTVEVSATEYEKKRKTFHVNITLKPTRVVEKIELNFFIQ
jgi:hypothetical protein